MSDINVSRKIIKKNVESVSGATGCPRLCSKYGTTYFAHFGCTLTCRRNAKNCKEHVGIGDVYGSLFDVAAG